MHNATSAPTPPRPTGKSVRINGTTVVMVENLKARYFAAFGSVPSTSKILQRGCELYCLDTQLPQLGSEPAKPPLSP